MINIWKNRKILLLSNKIDNNYFILLNSPLKKERLFTSPPAPLLKERGE